MFFFLAVGVVFFFSVESLQAESTCAAGGFEIMAKDCRNFFPNQSTSITYNEQEYIKTQIIHYCPLIHLNCSSLTLLFICSSHLPLCTSHRDIPPLLPCRSVCHNVYFNCIHFFDKTNLPWPHHLYTLWALLIKIALTGENSS